VTTPPPLGGGVVTGLWCQKYIGEVLPVTCAKDYDMELLYDDSVIQVVRNTGELINGPADSGHHCPTGHLGHCGLPGSQSHGVYAHTPFELGWNAAADDRNKENKSANPFADPDRACDKARDWDHGYRAYGVEEKSQT